MVVDEAWYRSGPGIAVVAVYGLLTILGVAISTGAPVVQDSALAVNGTATGSGPAVVPPAIYLYAFLGAMAYAFTSVVAKFERDLEGVIKVGLRALAALPLAAGVFLLAGALGFETTPIAGLAFLVGLYVNLTLKALGGLADRLYGRVPGGDGSADDDREDGSGTTGSGGPKTE